MLKTEIRKCKKCNKSYIWRGGGIVMTPEELRDKGICPACKRKVKRKTKKEN